MKVMIKYFLILFLLFFGYGHQSPEQGVVDNDTDTLIVKKHKHPADPEEPPICEDLTIAECLEIIIPALWEREIERDCE
ncbi:MAG TPA: hypothetical protein EYI82_02660 [Gammaproteobacteria bacterium]|nr:hypothetical protein [Gammaproteobacteria bacterium]